MFNGFIHSTNYLLSVNDVSSMRGTALTDDQTNVKFSLSLPFPTIFYTSIHQTPKDLKK